VHLFNQKYIKNYNIVEKVQLQVFCFSILKRIVFLWCKAEFSVLFIQSSVSHDPSNMMIWCSRNISYQCWTLFV